MKIRQELKTIQCKRLKGESINFMLKIVTTHCRLEYRQVVKYV